MTKTVRQGIGFTLAIFLCVGGGAFLIVGRLAPALESSFRARSLPVYGRLSPFDLTDQTGRRVGPAGLAGRVWVADFIFTRCAGICPIMSRGMKSLQNELAPQIGLVSFTSDPAYDTPQVLSDYAARYGAQPGRWLFLTGKKEALERVSQGFHMGKIDEPMMHSVKYVLIDRQGRVRGYYDSNEAGEVENLKRDAAALNKGGHA